MLQRDPAKHKDFEFNLRELSGSMGDFGTLFPLAIGLVAVCRVDPAGLFVMIGLTNIVTGLVYRLPMPVEPKKVLSVAAIAQGWTASMVAASGLGMGITWLIVALTGAMDWLARITPPYLVRGIQLALGFTLAREAIKMSLPQPLLCVLAVAIILLLRKSERFPAALVIMVLGVVLMAFRGQLTSADLALGISLPRFAMPNLREVWQTMVLAGFAQIPLSITNAVIATAAMIRELFPDKPVTEKRLMINMGVMNVASSFFGGMPMCHGSGGLAGQYYFGARTGGTNLLEGLIEISLGVFLGKSVTALLGNFPMPLIGGMMLMVGVQFVGPLLKLRSWQLYLALLTAVVSIATNMAVGFVVGLAVAHLVRRLMARGILHGSLGKP